MEIEHVLGAVKGQLNLNTSQQLMWDNAVAQTKAAHDAGRANMQKVHDALTAELAKPEPDLAAVAAVADSAQTSNQTLRQERARPVAPALRHVHAGAEGGRARRAARQRGADGCDGREDAASRCNGGS